MSPPPVPSRLPIRRLSPETVERIAAGEVVERPASVVKELVENALDAGATTVTVRLTDGGLDRIEVADDGDGIPADELALAVERHATNKLAPEGPVEGIGSLGFRGEALAAIATVSRVRLASRPRDRESAEGISVVGGSVVGRFSDARAPGTTVEVDELFFNTPARRKFLKSPAAEQLEALDVVARLYAARPTVTLRVEANGREVAVYPATSDLTEAATHVLGSEFRPHAFRIAGTIPGGRVYGALGRPPFAASSPRGLYLGVNGRTVASRSLQGAVRAAFAEELPRGRYPVGVLHLDLPLDRLDVNVHPTKREVRFLGERDLAEALRLCVRSSLGRVAPVSEVAPGARAGPFGAVSAPPRAPVSSLFEAVPAGRASGETFAQQTLDAPEALRERTTIRTARGRPGLKLLGCVHSLYWVAESVDGLVLVDQHAASERLAFEALRRNRPLARQTLVEPVAVRLSAVQRAAWAAHAEDVARAGFDVEEFGPETYRVRTVPAFRGGTVRADSVTELLDELARGGRPTVPDGAVDRAAATLACHSALRAGDVVSPEAFAHVLEELAALEETVLTCPHGRPIVLRFDRARLDRWFLRSGP